MKRLVLFLFIVLVAWGFSFAQIGNDPGSNNKYSFRYNVDPQSLSGIDPSMLQPHPFGEPIARKLYMLQDLYTYIEEATPTSPGEKTIVLKPNIYNSILKLNRYYKKMTKKGLIGKDEATQKLDYCLDVAISVVATQTDSLEADIKKAPDLDGIVSILLGVQLIK